jgi:hypothetical protein
LYDPKCFDYSKIPQPFAKTIKKKCTQEQDMFYQYKSNGRKVMETSAKYTVEQIRAKKEEMDRTKAAITFARKGIAKSTE